MKKITVYSTPSCHYCHLLKEYLIKKGYKFEDVNLSKDPLRGQEMVRLSGQMGVPVTIIDGKVLVGFNRQELDLMLK